MKLWQRKKERIKIAPQDYYPFDERHGKYAAVWERKAMPDPGAQNYAYESLALPEFAPSGPSITNRGQILSTFQPMYAGMGVPTNGIPLNAGSIYMAPLYDPNAGGNGYTAGIPAVLPPNAFNIIADRPDPVPTNAVSFGRPV